MLLAFLLALPAVRADSVDNIVLDELKKQNIPGVSIAVVKDGKLVKAAGYGVLNLETNTKATADTVYEIGSITKQFTATLVMMLVEEKKMDLEERILNIFPELPKEWGSVTVHHLLNHVSGLPDYTDPKAFDFTDLARSEHTLQEILEHVTKLPTHFTPGEKFEYCNFGYYLLGRILEKKSEIGYWDLLKKRILEPLGMTNTRPSEPTAIIAMRAHGYTKSDKGFKNADAITSSSGFSAGSIVSSVRDMAKWESAIGSEKLFSQSSWTKMWTPGKTNDGKDTTYGFGWVVTRINGHRALMHSGGTVGFITHTQNFIDDKLSVIVLTNSGASNPGKIAMRISAVYNKELAARTEAPIADNEPEIAHLLKKSLLQIADGELDKNDFTTEMYDFLKTKIDTFGPQIKSLGTIKKVDLLSKQTEGEAKKYRYRVQFETNTLTFTLTLNKAGKISGLLGQ